MADIQKLKRKVMRISQEDFKALEAKRLAKKPKYNNTKVTIDGHLFDSKKEGARWSELKLMQKAGLIENLERQIEYPIVINGHKVCKYVSDFTYRDVKTGLTITEDVKSEHTKTLPVYRLKKKLLFACLGISIQEI